MYFHALLVPLNSLQCLRFSSYQAGAVGQVYFRGYYLNRNCRVRQKQPTVKITKYFLIPFFAGDETEWKEKKGVKDNFAGLAS